MFSLKIFVFFLDANFCWPTRSKRPAKGWTFMVYRVIRSSRGRYSLIELSKIDKRKYCRKWSNRHSAGSIFTGKVERESARLERWLSSNFHVGSISGVSAERSIALRSSSSLPVETSKASDREKLTRPFSAAAAESTTSAYSSVQSKRSAETGRSSCSWLLRKDTRFVTIGTASISFAARRETRQRGKEEIFVGKVPWPVESDF